MTVQGKVDGQYYCGQCALDARGGDQGTTCPGCGHARKWQASVHADAAPEERVKPKAKRRPKSPPEVEREPKPEPKGNSTGQATGAAQATLSEGSFARAWAASHDLDRFLFVTGVGWLRFSAGTWSDGAVAARRGMAELIHGAVQQTPAAAKFDRHNVVEGALKMAQVQPSESRTVEVNTFDSDPMAIGLPEGKILEIATGKVRPAKPGDRLRRAIAFAPSDEPSSAWSTFIYESLSHYALDQRDAVAAWLQEFCGAMLSGNCADQKAVFVWGEAGTGKTVFAETLRYVMGSYAGVVAGERIAGREGGHRQWIVSLAGRRLVLISELPERARWHTADLNSLIEGGPLEANSMRQDSVTFNSTASVLIVGNHRPRASAASRIWRRLVQVEFRNKPEKPDPRLLDKLKAEAPGVLSWMCEGAARWHARGSLPQVPAAIRQAVESYRRESDPFAQYLAERTEKVDGASVGVDPLFDDFKSWWLREIDSDEKSAPKKRGFGTKAK